MREFGRYGIESVAINEDTSDASDVWKVRSLIIYLVQCPQLKGNTSASKRGVFGTYLYKLSN